jgi:hypothetical protein
MVYQVRSYDAEGKAEAPTVVKCDKLTLITEEIKNTQKIAKHLGDNYPKIIEMVTNQEERGKERVVPRGAVKMQFVGSALVLPILQVDNKAKLMTLFKDIYKARLGILSAKTDSERDRFKSNTDNIDFLADPKQVLHDTFEILSVPTEQEAKKEKVNVFELFPFQEEGKRCHMGDWLDWFGLDRYNELFHRPDGNKKRETADNNPDRLEDIDPKITDYLRNEFWDKDMQEKSKNYHEEHWVGLIHGDLNGANILVDTAQIISLIDFAQTEKSHVFVDLAKVEVSGSRVDPVSFLRMLPRF